MLPIKLPMKNNVASILLAVGLLVGCGNKEELKRERDARRAAEESRATWQTVSFVVGIGAVILLVFGTAIGSSARKEAERASKDTDE